MVICVGSIPAAPLCKPANPAQRRNAALGPCARSSPRQHRVTSHLIVSCNPTHQADPEVAPASPSAPRGHPNLPAAPAGAAQASDGTSCSPAAAPAAGVDSTDGHVAASSSSLDPWLAHVGGAYDKLWGAIRWGVDPKQPPLFLQGYPVPPGKKYTHNSFVGKYDPHGGKFYVPPEKQRQFCKEYLEHWQTPNTRSLFLTENYHDQPFRYFQELDFDFDLDHDLLEELSASVVALINKTVRQFFSLPSTPQVFVSLRTLNKIHLVYPEIITTEAGSRACRERLVERCQATFGRVVDDWSRVIDFPHGSLRMLGSLKPKRLIKDPEWVQEWMYKPYRLLPDGSWASMRLTVYVLMRSSIAPDQYQAGLFQRRFPNWRAELAAEKAGGQGGGTGEPEVDRAGGQGRVMRVYTGPRGDFDVRKRGGDVALGTGAESNDGHGGGRGVEAPKAELPKLPPPPKLPKKMVTVKITLLS